MEWVGVKMVTIPHYTSIFRPSFMGFHGDLWSSVLRAGKSTSNGSIIFLSTKLQLIAPAPCWAISHEIPMEIPHSMSLPPQRSPCVDGKNILVLVSHVFDDRSTLGTQQTRSCKSHLFPTKRTGHVPLRMPWLLWSRYPGTQVARAQRYVAGCCGSSSPKTMENQAAMKLIAIDPCPNDNFRQL